MKLSKSYINFVGDDSPTPSVDLNLDRKSDYVNQVSYDPDSVFDIDDLLSSDMSFSPNNQTLFNDSILLPEVEVYSNGGGQGSSNSMTSAQREAERQRKREQRRKAGASLLDGLAKGFGLGVGNQGGTQPQVQVTSGGGDNTQQAGFGFESERPNFFIPVVIGLIGFSLLMYGISASKNKKEQSESMEATAPVPESAQPQTEISAPQPNTSKQ